MSVILEDLHKRIQWHEESGWTTFVLNVEELKTALGEAARIGPERLKTIQGREQDT